MSQDWIVRVYSPTNPDRCIGTMAVENRSEPEAYRKAEAWAKHFIVIDKDGCPAGPCRWSLSPKEAST